MSRSDKKMEEVLRKIEELSEGMEPPPVSGGEGKEEKAAPGQAPKENPGEIPVLSKEDFDELEKTANKTSNQAITNHGLLESILVEMQEMNRSLKEMLE